jgi:sarcosine/dimethylglycine N-methyltransferase
MSAKASHAEVVEIAREYYNSEDADNFYFHIWGGEDIHIGMYKDDHQDIAAASHRTVRHMAETLPKIGASMKVLDLGSGYGGAARYLAKTYGCHVTALNLSETENARNREMTAKAGLFDLIEVVDGNFEEVPAQANQFDIVWSQDAILHSPRRGQVMKEVGRVLKPGGYFIFTDPMQADEVPEGVLQPVLDRIHLASLGSFAFYRSALKDAGLEEVSIEDLTPQLINHYSRVREELAGNLASLVSKVSDEYAQRMLKGLQHWVDAGKAGHLAWGIMCFKKPN